MDSGGWVGVGVLWEKVDQTRSHPTGDLGPGVVRTSTPSEQTDLPRPCPPVVV